MNNTVTLNLAIQPDFNCPGCKSLLFQPVMRMKIISGLLIGQSDPQLKPVNVIACMICGREIQNEDIEIQHKEKSAGHPALTLMQSGGES